ncbi:MAG: response regulator transcription factor [Agathobacter sp.]|nr:response regulator transcription factor [Agathobacter sp.]
MKEQYKVLIAEDEKGLRDILSKFLEKKGFEVDLVGDGDSACRAVDGKLYDIIVLDIMMPGKNGKEVCAHIRQKYDVPVIFLTALDSEQDIVDGYEIGADEYITKPFSAPVLLAKINALIKRYHGLLVKNGQIRLEEITIEPARRYVAVEGKEVVLAPKQYDLLMYMVENKNQVLSRNQILDKVWGMEYEGYDRAVDTHIKKLRAALGKASYHVETVIKAGYMWK